MKFKAYLLSLLVLISVTFVSCKDDDIELTDTEQTEYVNRWIYSNMTALYFWTDYIPKNPVLSGDPEGFFYSLLYKRNSPGGDRFSWIMKNYTDLLNLLSGYSSSEMGFEYVAYVYGEEAVYVRVLYVKPGTDANAKGLKRGMDIVSVNGVSLTRDNFEKVFRTNLDSYSFGVRGSQGDIEIIDVKSTAGYAENPVYLQHVYTYQDLKAGYLVYNFFASDKGDKSYSYDRQLADVFRQFENEGVTDVILDLRYNNGGSIESANYIASALLPDRATNKVFVNYEFNQYVMGALNDKQKRDYFTDKINGRYDIPRLGDQLDNIYIITSEKSASASELLINSLNAYIPEKIVQIGGVTVGKNVASVTLIEENDKYKKYNKYGMQPIVAKVANADMFSGFEAGFSPEEENMLDELEYPMYELGDVREPLLARALELISGQSPDRSQRSTRLPVRILELKQWGEKDNNMYINPEIFKDLIISE